MKHSLNIFLKRLILGISVEEEYICLERDSVESLLSVYLTTRSDEVAKNITNTHILLGYKPLIVAVPFDIEDISLIAAEEICLSFTVDGFTSDRTWKGFKTDHKSVAKLLLKKISKKMMGDKTVCFYEGLSSAHQFLPLTYRLLNSFYERVTFKKRDNIDLVPSLYEQVRIAYSIPRVISLILPRTGSKMNMFPTDLHGTAGDDYYVSSLRINGKAAQQVAAADSIVVCEIVPGQYKRAYELGKNHMKEPCEPISFKLSENLSQHFKTPLPEGAIKYYELEVAECFDIETHRIFVYKVLHHSRLIHHTPLTHAHAYYIQWLKNRRENPYLLKRN